jgi:hypothetical protein
MKAFFAPYLTWAANAWHDYVNALLHPNYTHVYWLILLPFALAAVALWGKRQMTIRHSTLEPHRNMSGFFQGWRMRWSLVIILSYLCLAYSIVNVNLAMMGPVVPQAKVEHLMQTRERCAAFDKSGSMSTKLEDGIKELADDEAAASNDPTAVTISSGGSNKTNVQTAKSQGLPTADQDAKKKEYTRAEGGQLAARYLIRHGMSNDPNNTDRMCMYAFDMDSYMMAPLTNDKLVALLRTVHITENVGGGTNFAGLSASGIGILQKFYDYFTTNTAENSVRVAILVTDGYDSIDPQRRKDLIVLYKQAHILLYVIGLGDGWKAGAKPLDLELFANELHAADGRSGIVFRASNPGAMTKAMDEIASLEKAQDIVETVETYRDVDYVFIFVAGVSILMFFGLATLARRVP